MEISRRDGGRLRGGDGDDAKDREIACVMAVVA